MHDGEKYRQRSVNYIQLDVEGNEKSTVCLSARSKFSDYHTHQVCLTFVRY